MKNLEEFENKDKIKEMLDTTKILKVYSALLHSEKTTQTVTKYHNNRCKIRDIIIEGKSYT